MLYTFFPAYKQDKEIHDRDKQPDDGFEYPDHYCNRHRYSHRYGFSISRFKGFWKYFPENQDEKCHQTCGYCNARFPENVQSSVRSQNEALILTILLPIRIEKKAENIISINIIKISMVVPESMGFLIRPYISIELKNFTINF